MIIPLTIFVVAYGLGCWLCYGAGFDKGVKEAAHPHLMAARMHAALAERELHDITRQAFEAMAERAARER